MRAFLWGPLYVSRPCIWAPLPTISWVLSDPHPLPPVYNCSILRRVIALRCIYDTLCCIEASLWDYHAEILNVVFLRWDHCPYRFLTDNPPSTRGGKPVLVIGIPSSPGVGGVGDFASLRPPPSHIPGSEWIDAAAGWVRPHGGFLERKFLTLGGHFGYDFSMVRKIETYDPKAIPDAAVRSPASGTGKTYAPKVAPQAGRTQPKPRHGGPVAGTEPSLKPDRSGHERWCRRQEHLHMLRKRLEAMNYLMLTNDLTSSTEKAHEPLSLELEGTRGRIR